ncbi:Anaphase-promoting complex subunit 10 [Borealophlyctis nickersoniae]|nr:Anaphase-promoting complex subunit 10 [Borealophlyctis nickersoniae]
MVDPGGNTSGRSDETRLPSPTQSSNFPTHIHFNNVKKSGGAVTVENLGPLNLISSLPPADSLSDKREISSLATWSVSSRRQGFGIEELRDESLEKYWQSDAQNAGPPHDINLRFPKKMVVAEISIYIDPKQDESYCPKRIVVRAGNSYPDLLEVTSWHSDDDGDSGGGWKTISLWEDEDAAWVVASAFHRWPNIIN